MAKRSFHVSPDEFLAPENETRGHCVGNVASCYPLAVSEAELVAFPLTADEGAAKVVVYSWLLESVDELARSARLLDEREHYREPSIGEKEKRLNWLRSVASSAADWANIEKMEDEVAQLRQRIAQRLHRDILADPLLMLQGTIVFANPLGSHERWVSAWTAALTASAKKLEESVHGVDTRTPSLPEKRRIVLRRLIAEAFRYQGELAPELPLPPLIDAGTAVDAGLRLRRYLKERYQVDAASFMSLPSVISDYASDAIETQYLLALDRFFWQPWLVALRQVVNGRGRGVVPKRLESWVNMESVETLLAKAASHQVVLYVANFSNDVTEEHACLDGAWVGTKEERYSSTSAAVVAVELRVAAVTTSTTLFYRPVTLLLRLIHSLAHALVTLESKEEEALHAVDGFYRTVTFCLNVAHVAGLLAPGNVFGFPTFGGTESWEKSKEKENIAAANAFYRIEKNDVADRAHWTTALLQKWLTGAQQSVVTRQLMARGMKRARGGRNEKEEEDEEDELTIPFEDDVSDSF